MIGLAEGDVVSIFVQAILFGLYLASLAHCLRWQLVDDEGWRLRTKINWAMLINDSHFPLFIVNDRLGYKALSDDSCRSGRYSIFQTVLECSAMLITDAVLIYRCWVVYARSWRIVCIPIFFWILLFASSIISPKAGLMIYQDRVYPAASIPGCASTRCVQHRPGSHQASISQL
ncbi:hypothetical protein M378DRAFT_130858 [Amanita muscaria Koide BX008]|uniref:Uncharacterized protein n=1 Tax=Amanita muscaria (strain Koide BX008) TaxID=946122 RepID=A0A0C2SB92_AMAMK|nr:hypothetical protein M378DRAFT_130858 [Amanita muscaria Koide BX008]